MPLRLSRAGRAEAERLAALLSAAHAVHNASTGVTLPTAATPPAEIRSAMAAGTAVLTAQDTEGEAPAAMCAVDPDGGIRWLAVAPGRERRGLGGALLGLAESFVRSLGRPRCHLETASAHPWLADWYRRRGYVAVTREHATPVCDLRLEKDFAAADPVSRPRCPWAEGDPLLACYHDAEWGLRTEGDRDLFERLMLEVFQTGLSWRTVMHKRAGLRRGLMGFEPARLAQADAEALERFLAEPGVIRSPRKFDAAVHNARAFRAMAEESGSVLGWMQGQDPAGLEAALRARLRYFGPSVAQSFFESTGLAPAPHAADCPGSVVWLGD